MDHLVLDAWSVRETGIEEFVADFRWPIHPETYDDLAASFDDKLLKIRDGRSSRALKAAIDVRLPHILEETHSLLAAAVDVAVANRHDLDLIHGPGSGLFDAVSQGRFRQVVPASTTHGMETGLPALETRLRSFLRSIRTRIRTLTRGAPYFVSPNYLAYQCMTDRAVQLGPRIRRLRYRSERQSVALPREVAGTVDEIAHAAGDTLQDAGFGDGPAVTEAVGDLVEWLLSSTWTDVQRDYSDLVEWDDACLLIGTGGSYDGRLAGHVFQRNGAPVYRFDHGGDRALFEDYTWGMVDFAMTDHYITHGAEAGDRLRDRLQGGRIPTLGGAIPDIGAIGSRRHRELQAQSEPATSDGWPETVMAVSASFLGDRRILPYVKYHDPIYLDFHVRLLHELAKGPYRLAAKRHPKGGLAQTALFEGLVDEEIRGRSLPEVLPRFEAVVLDIAGSAFVEALAAMKKVVLVHHPIRDIDPDVQDDLEDCCEIVYSWYEDDRLQVDFEEVRERLRQPLDVEARERFLERYLFEPDNVLSRFESCALPRAEDRSPR